MRKNFRILTKLLLAAVVCCWSIALPAQTISISGVVTDQSGTPLVGATVVIKNTSGKFEGGGNDFRRRHLHAESSSRTEIKGFIRRISR
mgnify:CR=1 FL=1